MVKEWTYTETDVDERGNIVETGKKENYLGVDYGAMDFIIINAIKELKERIEVLEAENERLRNQH